MKKCGVRPPCDSFVAGTERLLLLQDCLAFVVRVGFSRIPASEHGQRTLEAGGSPANTLGSEEGPERRIRKHSDGLYLSASGDQRRW